MSDRVDKACLELGGGRGGHYSLGIASGVERKVARNGLV
jgi:hypothetical protein